MAVGGAGTPGCQMSGVLTLESVPVQGQSWGGSALLNFTPWDLLLPHPGPGSGKDLGRAQAIDLCVGVGSSCFFQGTNKNDLYLPPPSCSQDLLTHACQG